MMLSLNAQNVDLEYLDAQKIISAFAVIMALKTLLRMLAHLSMQ